MLSLSPAANANRRHLREEAKDHAALVIQQADMPNLPLTSTLTYESQKGVRDFETGRLTRFPRNLDPCDCEFGNTIKQTTHANPNPNRFPFALGA